MLLVLLAVLALALAQDGTLANPWLITCGYRSAVREREWNIYRCYPLNLTVNNGDYVVVRTLNGGNIITFYGSLGPQTSVNPETTEANPLCFLGRTPIFGGQNLTESFNDGVFHYAFPSFVDGAVYITDPQKFYSSGIIMEDDAPSRAKLFDLPAGTNLTADYLVRFNSTEAGPFNYASCFEPWVGGSVYIGTPDKTIAEIDAGRATYHANYDTRFLQLSDIHKLGGQYRTPDTEVNEEGFLTHLVKVGIAEASTDAFYNAFGTPNFTISQGDTVAFVSQWYREGREFVHTFKMNVSKDDANWVPEYHNYDTPAAYLVFPQPDAGGNLIFQPYFPRYQYITAFGMWDSGQVWFGFGDASNFEDGEMSLGRLNADDQFSDQKNSKNITFPKTGYYPYACTLHYSTNMHGKIQVLPRANSRRTKYQIDATLNKLKLKHLVDYVAQDPDWPNTNHISWELVSGTHGILSTTSDAGSFETPLLVQFSVTYTLKDPRPFSQTGDLQPLQNNIIQFIALRTWTETSDWDIQNVQTAVPKTTSTKRDTGDQVDVTFVLTYNSAGAMGWSLALFLTSLFLLLVQ